MVLLDIRRLEALEAVAMGVDSDAFWGLCSGYWADMRQAQAGVRGVKDHGRSHSFSW